MPDSTSPESVEDKLKAVFAHPQTRAMIASAIASPRPNGWSKHSKATYYKKCYADWIKQYIDMQLKDPSKDIVLPYSVFCDRFKISERTLYVQVNQGILFLTEKMDPTGVYKDWYNNVSVDCKGTKEGIRLSMARVKALQEVVPVMVEPRETMPNWRHCLVDWMESGSSEPFVKEHIFLTTEEITSLRDEFLPNEGLMVDIKSSSIKIIKV